MIEQYEYYLSLPSQLPHMIMNLKTKARILQDLLCLRPLRALFAKKLVELRHQYKCVQYTKPYN